MKKNNKITIGLFNDSFFPMADGVVMVVDNYARRLSKYANVIVFVPRYIKMKFDDKTLPYKVVRCASIKVPHLDYNIGLPKLDFRFMHKIHKYKLDIVHVHSPFTIGKVGYEYAKKHNIPCIATMHSQFKQDIQKAIKNDNISDKLNKDLFINFFDKFDECWAVNKEVARIYYEDYHCKKLPRVMNNATEMLPVNDKKEARKYINNLYNIRDDEFVFLFVGRINTLKNILFIADALKIISDKRPDMKYKMLYVGSGQDSEKLEKHINELEINNNVILCGKVTDHLLLAKYYSRADLFLFPSIYDASSIVQIEAASQGCPAVFLKGTATASTVTDNVDGLLSDNDPEKYADLIIKTCDDKEKMKSLRENAYKNLYVNWDDKVKEVYDLYLEFIKKGK